MSNVKLIFAVSTNNIIGRNTRLPWHLPRDLDRFRKLTEGGIVVMGHNTWDGLPGRFRPLPKRVNVVLSEDPDLKIQGALVFSSVEQVIEEFRDSGKDIWFIGGHRVLKDALQYADRIELTLVLKHVQGDVTGPYINMDMWNIIEKSSIQRDDASALTYQFLSMVRRE